VFYRKLEFSPDRNFEDTLYATNVTSSLINLFEFCLQFSLHNLADRYVRLQEIPFSSEQKLMIVKCVPKGDEVGGDALRIAKKEFVTFTAVTFFLLLIRFARRTSKKCFS
jgi:hypothetical protein